MIRFACPGCSATFSVDDSKGGKTGKCPKCNSEFLIPDADPPAAASPPPPPPRSAPPPPPPPPAADEAVEIKPCPKCGTKLTVMGSDLGLEVECPECTTVFKAEQPGPSRTSKAPPPAPPPPPKRPAADMPADTGRSRPSSRRATDDDEDDDRPRSRRRPADEDEDDRPKRRRPADDDDDDDRPKRRMSGRDDDDEEEDRPRKKKKKRRRSGGGEPHRGGVILTLGIMGFVCCIGFGIAAFIMANTDLAKMDDGTMDDSGRGLTNAGRIISMIAMGLFVLGIIAQVILAVAGK